MYGSVGSVSVAKTDLNSAVLFSDIQRYTNREGDMDDFDKMHLVIEMVALAQCRQQENF